MPANWPTQYSPSQLQARACQWVGISLICLFLISLLNSFLPPQLLDPDWQLKLVGRLTDNGAYPLLGLLLVSLASFLNPDDASLQKRQLRLRALACWVSLAYLLLIPLIGVACQRGLNQASVTLRRQNLNAQQAIVAMRGVIQKSRSLPELQAGLRQMKAPTLTPEASLIPLADLKAQILNNLQSNENRLKTSQRQPLFTRFLPLLQKALRDTLACVALAVGFAAVALPKGASRSQLMGWASSLDSIKRLWNSFTGLWRNWRKSSQDRREFTKRMAMHLHSRSQAERQASGKSSKEVRPSPSKRSSPQASGKIHNSANSPESTPNHEENRGDLKN